MQERVFHPSRPLDDLEFWIWPPKVPLKFQGASFEPIKFFWKKIFNGCFSGSGRKFRKNFCPIFLFQVQWSFLSALITWFPLFIALYRSLGQNCPKADATIIQMKADATINVLLTKESLAGTYFTNKVTWSQSSPFILKQDTLGSIIGIH